MGDGGIAIPKGVDCRVDVIHDGFGVGLFVSGFAVVSVEGKKIGFVVGVVCCTSWRMRGWVSVQACEM